jgi:hypothetical protein
MVWKESRSLLNMVTSAGWIDTAFKKLQIYAILRGNYIYIGVSDRLIVNRWSAHFSENGSFMSALRRANEDEVSREREVHFSLYDLSTIEKHCKPEACRRALEYIEHELHLHIGRSRFFTPKFRLISDTLRTAPTNCSISSEYIEDAITYMVHDLEQRAALVV